MNNKLLGNFANIVAIVGILVCALAGASRLHGMYTIFGFEAMTLFVGGTALMVFATLMKLHIISEHILQKPRS